ncbi:alpha/beta hydrolase [Dongshaea marina]|uniref:alpha/beta hydrolase n=1 Tax=Dongshaea marina TaxID=2047966 RepID=UPI000D3E082C|nr:alpha/beta hydrolase [Dongshaea marina]
MNNKSLIFITLICSLMSSGCKYVINAMAFHPDTRNTLPSGLLPKNVEEVSIDTSDHLKIEGYFIPDLKSDKILLYFHGNAGNISHRLDDLLQLHRMGINVLGIGYRGYGKSQGEPSEEGIYIDGSSAFHYAVQQLGFKAENIYILGRSIGTTVAVNTAQNKEIRGLILITPLTSAKDYAQSGGLSAVSFLAGDSFDNIGKIENILSPVLIVHGDRDSVIPIHLGKKLFNKIKANKEFIEIDGAGHNNLSTTYAKSYWSVIQGFIDKNNQNNLD